MSDPDVTVDIRFTSEGVSASMYDADANVLDEAWYTWAEVGGMKADDRSHITFEYGESGPPDILRHLVALERDRELGYPGDELHMDPADAIEDALELFDDPDDVVWPEDQKKLGIGGED